MILEIYQRAQQTPEKPALVYNNVPFSYRALARAIDATRRYLSAEVPPRDGIAVVAANSRLIFWCLGLGLRSLGLTTISVPSLAEIDRLGLSRIGCVLTADSDCDADVARLCATAGWRLITVPLSIYRDIATGPAPPLPAMPAGEGGHILLTSGTTGFHKKILIDAGNLASLAGFRRKFNGLSANSVVNILGFPGWSSSGYVRPNSVWESGGTVVAFDRPEPWEAFRYEGITDAVVNPGMLETLLRAPPGALCRNDAIRLVVTAGSPSQALVEEARRRLTRRICISLASTEGLGIALTPIEGPEDLRWHRLLPEREVQIVDERDRVLSAGRLGIVRVRLLPGMGEGYLDDPEASRAFFRNGYFYPGDLGVIRSDGRLALRGRVTEVVNFRGKKLACRPIEEMMQDKLGVAGVCLFSLPDATGEEVIHVAIEARQPIPHADLAAAIHAVRIPAAHIRIHYVESLPRNQMGKLQRDLLKQRLGAPSLRGAVAPVIEPRPLRR